jgi:hypothetical protein
MQGGRIAERSDQIVPHRDSEVSLKEDNRSLRTYPCPSFGGGAIPPKVIEKTTDSGQIDAITAEEPKIAGTVDPGDGTDPFSRNV